MRYIESPHGDGGISITESAKYHSKEYCCIEINPFFRKVIYEELQLCDDDFTLNAEFPLQETALGETLVMPLSLFSDDGRGNIAMTPVRLDRSVQQKTVKRSKGSKSDNLKVETYRIIRYANPDEQEGKYDYPTGYDSQLPFIPPKLIEAYENKKEIPTLVLTEGYKKAAKGSKHGLDVVGLPSITVFTDKSLERQGLFPDIVRLIKECGVKNVIILWDGDCRNFSQKDFDKSLELTRRPYQFFNMVVKLREFLKDYPVQVYFAHVLSDSYPTHPKGLDDILVAAGKDANMVASDLVLFDGKSKYFYRTEITAYSFKNKILSYFGLSSAQDFYALHQHQIGDKAFMFGKRGYQATNGQLRDITAVDVEMVRKQYQIPDGVDVQDFILYNFYEFEGCYWSFEKGSHVKLSNFTMVVKHLIRGLQPKRIVEIRNVFGITEQIELSIEELISISKFKIRIEGFGNFSFEGTDRHLTKIKQKLYAQEQQCKEFQMLGHQQRDNCWAWANGVYRYDTKEFTPVDEYGMLEIDGNSFYLPYYSSLHKHADEEFGSLRKFSYQRSTDTVFSEWSKKFFEVFGENGMLALSWAVATLYRDIIMTTAKGFPMLFAAGKKGSGKGTMTEALLHLWGEPPPQIMLSGKSTTVAFMRKMAQVQNGVVWLDEYSDGLDEGKIQSLKNIWDGVGYERGNKSNDTTTNVVPVRASAIISGQDLPTADGGSLFSRVILTQFIQTAGYTDRQIQLYTDLVSYQERGLTPIVHELLQYRTLVAAKFAQHYRSVCDEIRRESVENGAVIEERTIKNYAILIAVTTILSEHIVFPFNGQLLKGTLTKAIAQQQSLVRGSTELQTFWEMMSVFIANGKNGGVVDGIEVQIEGHLIYVRILLIMPLYLEAGSRQKLRTLKKPTLMEFLRTSEEFHSQKEAHRFDCGSVTSCMVFDRMTIYKNYDVWLCKNGSDDAPTGKPETEEVPF